MITDKDTREIRYRFWNTDHIDSPWMEIGDTSDIKFVERSIGKDKMRFTGLQDKNKKDIYEGDIVRRGSIRKEVKWVICQNQCGFNVGKGAGYLNPKTDTQIEIIGNIYENPELLISTTKENAL